MNNLTLNEINEMKKENSSLSEYNDEKLKEISNQLKSFYGEEIKRDLAEMNKPKKINFFNKFCNKLWRVLH